MNFSNISNTRAALLPLIGALLLSACGDKGDETGAQPPASEPEAHADDGIITLSDDQIASAGIQIGRPVIGGAGTLELPATIEADPDAIQVVSAAIGGRLVALTRNLGQEVSRGQPLAMIESREAAQLKGEVEASRARLALANSNLAREQRLFAQRVSPEQDLVAARTAAAEAGIAYRQAVSQVAAAGGGGGSLNRLSIPAPISGQVIARSVTLGQTVAADAELYRIANLSRLALSLNLQPSDAGRVRPGASVAVSAAGRRAVATVRFISPVLDTQTRLVPVIAMLNNRAGLWRVGEPVTASVPLADSGSDSSIRVPATAVQTVGAKPVLFVRTASGFRAVPVTLGDSSGNFMIVRTGLTGQERIATTNSFTLKAELGKGEAAHED